MAEGKYAKYVIDVKDPGIYYRPNHEGKAVSQFLMTKHTFEESQYFVESFIVYAADAGWGDGTRITARWPSEPEKTFTGSPHSHSADEVFLFLGTDPNDPTDLGGEHEFWLGEGEDAEQFIFTKSTCIYCPAHVVHNPNYTRKVWRPYLQVVFMGGTTWVTEKTGLPLPPGFHRISQ
jgi:hypothetical protein